MSEGTRQVDQTPAALQEEREFLLGSLADLEAERSAGDIDEHDYLTLKDGYTARAAAVLRAIDQQGVGPATTPSQQSQKSQNSPQSKQSKQSRRTWVKVGVVTGVAAAAVLAGLLVSSNLGQRLPGSTVTGAIQQTGPEAQLAQAQQDLSNGKYLDAVKTYEAILNRDPRNPEALAYRGWILYLVGKSGGDQSLIDRGLASVRDAEAADGTYADAHFFAGMILMNKGDAAGAAAEFRQALADNPPAAMVPQIQGVLQTAEATAATTTTAPSSPATSKP